MENLITFTLFGNTVVFLIVSLVLLILLFTSDAIKNGTLAFVATLIFIVCYYFWGDGTLLKFVFTWRNVGIYIFLGFVFSLVRTYFKGREFSKRDKKHFDLKNHIFRWWFLFPFAMTNWIFSNLLTDFWNFIYSHISKIYVSIFNLSNKDENI